MAEHDVLVKQKRELTGCFSESVFKSKRFLVCRPAKLLLVPEIDPTQGIALLFLHVGKKVAPQIGSGYSVTNNVDQIEAVAPLTANVTVETCRLTRRSGKQNGQTCLQIILYRLEDTGHIALHIFATPELIAFRLVCGPFMHHPKMVCIAGAP